MYEELLISGDQLPTKHPKIFKSMEEFPKLNVINSLIKDIMIAIDEDDGKKLIDILKTNVEGFIIDEK